MPRKYYFDNKNGNILFAQALKDAGVKTDRQMGFSPETSIFLKYKDVFDPEAEITYDSTDQDAIRLIEISWHEEDQIRNVLDAIRAIGLTKNTIVVNFFEPIGSSLLAKEGVKVISVPWGEPDTELTKGLPYTYPMMLYKDDVRTGTFPRPDYFSNTNKPYKFLNLCNRDEPWKFLLTAALHSEELADQGLISYRCVGQKPGWRTQYYAYKNTKYWPACQQLLDANFNKSLGEDIDVITGRRRYSHNPKWYETTWMSVVTESTTYSQANYPFITEKTVAPLVAGHPFVVYGENDLTTTLTDLGFDVFSWLFEHRQLTSEQRLLSRVEQDVIKVDNVIKDIKSFSPEMVLDNRQLVAEAIAHNRNVLDTDYRRVVSAEWQRVIGELV